MAPPSGTGNREAEPKAVFHKGERKAKRGAICRVSPLGKRTCPFKIFSKAR